MEISDSVEITFSSRKFLFSSIQEFGYFFFSVQRKKSSGLSSTRHFSTSSVLQGWAVANVQPLALRQDPVSAKKATKSSLVVGSTLLRSWELDHALPRMNAIKLE